MITLEQKTYDCMFNFRDMILKHSQSFNISPYLLSALIYVEKNQEDIDIVKDMIRDAKNAVATVAGALGLEIEKIVRCSFGYTHIKYPAVAGARQILSTTKYNNLIQDTDLEGFALSVGKSIKLSAAIVRAIIEWWRPVLDISNKHEIVGTIYNMVDFQNNRPAPKINPQVGGTYLSTVIDGKIVQDYFGNRVSRVYGSQALLNFMIR